MKIFLKDMKTGLLVKASGDWTSKASQAMNFDSAAAANDYRHSHKCFLTSIICRFRDPRHDIVLESH